MKKMTFTLTAMLLVLVSAFSQTTIVDFESIPYEQGAWNGTGEVIANTLMEGINSSDSVCKYTIPADAAWGNCAWVIFEDNIEYATLDSLQVMVLAPSATQMYVKIENTAGGVSAEAYATPVESSDWQLVTLKFSGISGEDSINATFDKIALFFNVNDGNGGEEWIYDNVVVFSAESSTAISKKADALNYKVYPNPAKDYITIQSDAQFVEVYSITGALLSQEVILSQNQTLYLGALNKGVYLIKVITNNNQSQVFKITKE